MYIAKKPCKFAGHKFQIGEAIPDGHVHDVAVPRLISMGVIAEVPEGSFLPSEPSMEEGKGHAGADPSECQDLAFEALMKHKRDELVELARKHGIEEAEGDTKKDLAEAILEAQRSEAQ